MDALDLVALRALMDGASGRPEVRIGLIDGPVAREHPDLADENVEEIPGSPRNGACSKPGSLACTHGTFVAGILAAKRSSAAPAICPGCTLLIRPVFSEAPAGREGLPSATQRELATAIRECIEADARVVNLSLAIAGPSSGGDRELEFALGRAVQRGVIIVAAAGNQGVVGSSAISRHPWVIPVAACDDRGRPMRESNLGGSIGQRGLIAPGDAITSLGAEGPPLTLGGTSVAAPFVTGTIALLWSEFPYATAAQIRLAVTFPARRRASVVPPLLNAEAARRSLAVRTERRSS